MGGRRGGERAGGFVDPHEIIARKYEELGPDKGEPFFGEEPRTPAARERS